MAKPGVVCTKLFGAVFTLHLVPFLKTPPTTPAARAQEAQGIESKQSLKLVSGVETLCRTAPTDPFPCGSRPTEQPEATRRKKSPNGLRASAKRPRAEPLCCR